MKLPERKQIRLQNYDYSSPGAYYVTLCTEKRRKVLSDIIVGQGLAPAETRLSHYGKIAEEQLLLLQKRYDFIKIDKFVIMPDHIHAIVIFKDYAAMEHFVKNLTVRASFWNKTEAAYMLFPHQGHTDGKHIPASRRDFSCSIPQLKDWKRRCSFCWLW